jgi:hypothetical protein
MRFSYSPLCRRQLLWHMDASRPALGPAFLQMGVPITVINNQQALYSPILLHLSMSPNAGPCCCAGRSAAMPLFQLASATEVAPAARSSGSSGPNWRVVAGNLAAGATAGCCVEAGESACAPKCMLSGC